MTRSDASSAFSRRALLRFGGATAAVAALSPLAVPSRASALSSGIRSRQAATRAVALHEVFADDHRIGLNDGFTRAVVPARRLDEPVIRPDRPWETGTYLYGSVMADASGGFRMFYSQGGTLYAESADGINWDKPALGQYVVEGNDTNYVFRGNPVGTLTSVVHDPSDPGPAKAYKSLRIVGAGKTRPYAVSYSADGIQWTEPPNSQLALRAGEVGNVIRDPLSGDYLAYLRREVPSYTINGLSGRRRLVISRSSDFVNWTTPQTMLDPDAIDDAWCTEPLHRTEFYGMGGSLIGSQYLGLLCVFRVTGHILPPASGQSGYEGPIHCELISSRDGVSWERCSDRSPVLPNGPAGSFDAGAIMNVADAPVLVGDEVWWYYTAINTTHGGTVPPKQITIGRAAWKRDRMVGMTAGALPATLETTDMSLTGLTHGQLVVNADAGQGTLRVEIVDGQGRPIPGYGQRVLHGDDSRHVLTWRGDDTTLPAVPTARLRFHGVRSTVYSYRIEA